MADTLHMMSCGSKGNCSAGWLVAEQMISERVAKTLGTGRMQKNHLKPLGKLEVTFNISISKSVLNSSGRQMQVASVSIYS
jgi:hypothetical protein